MSDIRPGLRPACALHIRPGIGIVANEGIKAMTIDIAVYIDGATLWDTEVAFQSGTKPDPADFTRFDILRPGTHVVRIESVKGGARHEQKVKIAGDRYMQIDYLFNARTKAGEFAVVIQDKPFYYR